MIETEIAPATPPIIEPQTEQKPHNRKPIIIASIVITLFILAIGGFYIFKAIRSLNDRLEEANTLINNDTNTKPKSAFGSFVSGNSYVAFATSTKDDTTVRIYDLNKEDYLVVAPEMFDFSVTFTLGPWSPDGKYLPVLKTKIPYSTAKTLYFYDPTKTLIKSVKHLEGEAAEDYKLDYSGMIFGSRWLDNSSYAYYLWEGQADTIDINGHESVKPIPADSDEDNIVGTIAGKNVVIEAPKPEYDISSYMSDEKDPKLAELEKLMDEKRQQGASEEEIGDYLFELLEPKGDTIAYLVDPTTNTKEMLAVLGSAELPHIADIQIDSTDKIVYKREDKSLLASKFEFVEVDIENKNSNTLITKQYADQLKSTPSSVLDDGVHFFISRDNNWLIYYFGDDIYILNRDTKVEKRICATNEDVGILGCAHLKVNNPLYSQ